MNIQSLWLNQRSASVPNKQRWTEERGHNPAEWQDMWLSTQSPNLHIRAVQTGGASEQISSTRLKHPPVALSSVYPNRAHISAWKWHLLNVNNL